MSETTTTVADQTAAAGIVPQVEAQDQGNTAGSSASENSTGTQPGGDTAAETTAGTEETKAANPLKLSEEQVAWLQSKGADPNDPQSVVDAVRNADKGFHQDRQEQAKAKQTISEGMGQDETVQAIHEARGEDPELVQIKQDLKEERFYRLNPEAQGHEDEIIAVGKRYPKLAADFDLSTLWAIYKSERVDDVVAKAKRETEAETKQQIAKQSVASVPSGTGQSGGAKPQTDPFLTGFNQR